MTANIIGGRKKKNLFSGKSNSGVVIKMDKRLMTCRIKDKHMRKSMLISAQCQGFYSVPKYMCAQENGGPYIMIFI